MPSNGWKIVYHQGTIFFAALRKPGNIGQNPPKSQEGHVFRRLLRPTEMHCRKRASRVTISKSRELDARSVRGAGGGSSTNSASSGSNLRPAVVICVERAARGI